MTIRPTLITTLAAALLLSACNSHDMTLREGFGNSIRTNTAMQVVDPEAGSADAHTPSLYGPRAEQVMEQYKTGETTAAEAPEVETAQ